MYLLQKDFTFNLKNIQNWIPSYKNCGRKEKVVCQKGIFKFATLSQELSASQKKILRTQFPGSNTFSTSDQEAPNHRNRT